MLTAHRISPRNHRRRREITSTSVRRRPVLSGRVRPSYSHEAREGGGDTDCFSVDEATTGGGDEAADAEGAPEGSVEDTGGRASGKLDGDAS